MAVERAQNDNQDQHLELPVEELLRRARPLRAREVLALDDLSEEEGEAFLTAANS